MVEEMLRTVPCALCIITEKGRNNMPTMNMIQQAVNQAAAEYPVKRIELFGSYADGTADEAMWIFWSNLPKILLLLSISAVFVKLFQNC